MKSLGFSLLIILLAAGAVLTAGAYTCGSQCHEDSDCQSSVVNPCTFCLSGQCSPMCGVGCRSDSDCRGGANPCTVCDPSRVCSNPIPECGSFCGHGVDLACRFNGSSTAPCAQSLSGKQCCQCHPTDLDKGCGNWNSNCDVASCKTSADCTILQGNCTQCLSGKCQAPPSSKCGIVCQANGQCQGGDGQCTQCIGFFCSKPQSSGCGNVCVSSGQCQANDKCRACIGAVCQEQISCGGACGDDSWCTDSCPVCNRVAQCATSF